MTLRDCVSAFLLGLFIVIAPQFVQAQNAPNVHYPALGLIQQNGATLAQCQPSGVIICGQQVAVPVVAPIGYSQTFLVPSPYEHQVFTVKCINQGGFITFRIVDDTGVTCTLQKCPQSNVNVCGASVSVPAGIPIGNRVDVTIPSDALAQPSAYTSANFTAQCVDHGDGGAGYEVADASEVSCNLFPCMDSTVRVCDTDVPVKGKSPMGAVMNMTMPPPFLPEEFTVQCLGTAGKAPYYQVTDSSGLTCKKAVK